jgi:hypothetical protein
MTVELMALTINGTPPDGFVKLVFLDIFGPIPLGILNEKERLRKWIYGVWPNPLDTQNPSSYIAAARKEVLPGHFFIESVRSKNSGPLQNGDIYRGYKAALEGTTLHLG